MGRHAPRPPGVGSATDPAVKALIYSRVSTADQDPRKAVAELRRACRRRGWTVTQVVTETGSGGRADRPGWQKVLAAARGIEWVVVWALDRAGRSTLDLLAQVEQLRRAGCGLWATSQGLEIGVRSDHTSQLTLQVLAAVAEFERGLIRGRTRAGLERARARGAVLGRPRAKRPARAVVLRLRRARRSWSEVAGELGCSVWVARSVAGEVETKKAGTKAARR
jgi:DNA invertase Pin-like site-specific DNA recombinase